MEMTFKGTPKEIAALVLELQERQDVESESKRTRRLLNQNFSNKKLYVEFIFEEV